MNLLSSVFSQKDGSGTPTTGSGRRDDGKVTYGYALMRGKRSSMEDFHTASFKASPVNGEQVGFFGVFDGHGGPRAADYVQKHLFDNLLTHNKFSDSEIKSALEEVFVQTDMNYMRSEQGRDDGCTAATCLLMGRRLLVANVGDSRVVMCRQGKAVPLSVDHKPNRTDERERIEAAGGVVVWAGTWRVGGVLAVSRAFGDRLLKRYVVAVPEIQDETLTSADEFVVIASDGLWDVLSNAEAIQIAGESKDPEVAAQRLAEEAFRRGSADNISCVCMRFNWD